MPTIIGSLTSLVSSIFQTVGAALQSVYAVFQTVLSSIISTIQVVFAVIWGAISNLAQTFEGLTRFLLGMYRIFEVYPNIYVPRFLFPIYPDILTGWTGNILVIGGAVAALVLYKAYQQRPPAKQKKTS